MSTDYSSVIFTRNSKIISKDKPCTLYNTKTKWPYFQELLKTTLDNSILLRTNNDITRAVESSKLNAVQQAFWSAMLTSICNPDINIVYSPAIKRNLAEKRKLRRLWQTNRCPVTKNKLNRAIKALKNLLNSERNQGI